MMRGPRPRPGTCRQVVVVGRRVGRLAEVTGKQEQVMSVEAGPKKPGAHQADSAGRPQARHNNNNTALDELADWQAGWQAYLEDGSHARNGCLLIPLHPTLRQL